MLEKEEDAIKVLPPQKTALVSEPDIAMDFALKVHRKFDKLIKATILFGSQVKNTATATSDIDIIIIIDDASIAWDLELIAWYREELAKIIFGNKYKSELHINTVKLTTWWQDLLYGDPIVINILRYGEALIDSGGFFAPIKSLLLQGKIRSTPEAVYAALQRAPNHLARSRAATLGAIEGVYWAMVDSAQAALITAGKVPPSPEHIPAMLKDVFVDRGLLNIEDVRALRDLYLLHKTITHGESSHIKGAEIDSWQEKTEKFIGNMTTIIAKLLDSEKSKK
ncbi:MAG: nucleotidyltransferase domain-containing protein [Nanoarchaeota archaeon]